VAERPTAAAIGRTLGRAAGTAARAAAVLGAWAGLVVPLAALLRDAGRGLDLTDESHYLLAARPWASTSAFNGVFGWYLGPLSRVLGDDVGRLRVFAVLALVVAALWLARCTRLAAEALGGGTWPGWLRRAAPAGFAAAALSWHVLFLRTPGYGWFAVTGLVLVTAGVVLLVADPPWGGVREVAVPLSLGAGLLVTAVGKLSTGAAAVLLALAAAVVAVVVAAAARSRPGGVQRACARFGGALVVVAAGLMVHLTLVADAGATRLALSRAATVAGAVDPAHYRTSEVPGAVAAGAAEIAGLHGTGLGVLALLPLLGLLPVPARLRAAVSRRRGPARPRVLLCVPGFALPVLPLVSAYREAGVHLPLAAVPVLVAGATAVVHAVVSVLRRQAGPRVPLLGLLCAVPVLAYPLGTNNSYLVFATGGAAPLLAGITVCCWAGRGRGRAGLVALVVAGSVLVAAVVVPAARERMPYRTLPLEQQTVPVDMVAGEPPVLVDPRTADWALGLRSAAVADGWRPGTPLLDMSWRPAAVLVLDGRAPGALLPSFPRLSTRAASAVAALRAEPDPARWRTAWLLVPRRHPEATREAVAVVGRRFPQDYRLVVAVTSPFDGQQQQLWRPVQ